MPEIHVLDSETIDKIAAGEVVERPASVVKELVENAMDAGADAITVEVKDGGIEFVRVTDNGSGIRPEQLRTAFLRHATSKIKDANDLMSIHSLGFRGEALSSIAAVSKVEVITKTPECLTGYRICIEGADEKEFQEVGAPDGTTFIMRNLFYNTPVRRKFLKQPATEGGYITDLMEHLALSRPDISFKFVLGNQTKFHTSGNGDLKEVIYRVFGREIANALIPIQCHKEGIKIEGYLGKPVLVRSNRNFEVYYLNRRFIRSTVVAKAIEEGYKEYLMQHKFPFCVLHIAMDTDRVDVNVHPTKMDVRFSDSMSVSEMIAQSVSVTLKNREMITAATIGRDKEAAGQRTEQNNASKCPEPFENVRRTDYRVREEARYEAEVPKMQEFMQSPLWNRVKSTDIARNAADDEAVIPEENDKQPLAEEEDVFFAEIPDTSNTNEAFDTNEPSNAKETSCEEKISDDIDDGVSEEQPVTVTESPKQMQLFEDRILTEDNRPRFRIIGQVFETYWMIEFEDKLLMIDQHAAHEKVKYERLMKQYYEKSIVSQALFPPIIVTLSGQEESALKEYLDIFLEMGFEIEEFGGSEYAMRSVPVDLYGLSERELFLEVLDELCDGIYRKSPQAVEEKIASMSCKAAVKGNHLMSYEEADRLIDELLSLENPYNCPHGRPTIITISKYEMEKKFKRII